MVVVAPEFVAVAFEDQLAVLDDEQAAYVELVAADPLREFD